MGKGEGQIFSKMSDFFPSIPLSHNVECSVLNGVKRMSNYFPQSHSALYFTESTRQIPSHSSTVLYASRKVHVKFLPTIPQCSMLQGKYTSNSFPQSHSALCFTESTYQMTSHNRTVLYASRKTHVKILPTIPQCSILHGKHTPKSFSESHSALCFTENMSVNYFP